MPPRELNSPTAPKAIGPYSHAVQCGQLLFCSGMIAVDPVTGALVADSVGAEVQQCLANLEEVCRAADTGLGNAVRLTVYTTELHQFSEINDAYERTLGSARPARVTIGVDALPMGAKVEIEAIVAVAQ